MMISDSVVDAAGFVVDALAGSPVTVHPPPVPAQAPAGPCILVHPPEITETVGSLAEDCPRWAMQVGVLVIAADTTGHRLHELYQDTAARLHRAGLRVTSRLTPWQPPDHPSPVPAVLITAA